jgi:hypothetical protein
MNCLVCGAELEVNLCHGKRNRKAIMLSCPNDGRHFRAFINEPRVVGGISELNLSLEEALAQWQEKSNQMKQNRR